jgi:branched-chain amino acid transport system ATP-binding protein
VELLSAQKLSKNFEGLTALYNLDVDVVEGEILGVIGPNGAGKTTLFNLITGFLRPSKGRIIFRGNDITGLRADRIARLGLARTFQACVLYSEATCFENVLMGFHMLYRQPRWKAFFHTRAARTEEHQARDKALELLEFMGLQHANDELACNLPHGEQRILGICIALATTPRLLLLDEPATGMNAQEAAVLVTKIRQIREGGITVVLVEHNVKAVMDLCDRIMVLSNGQKIAAGAPEQIQNNEKVLEAYLGRGE